MVLLVLLDGVGGGGGCYQNWKVLLAVVEGVVGSSEGCCYQFWGMLKSVGSDGG